MYAQCLKQKTGLLKQITGQSHCFAAPQNSKKIVYNCLYEYLMDNNLLIEQNYGCKRKDSTVNQLLKNFHQIYQDINSGKDTCLVFLIFAHLLTLPRILGCIAGALYDWLEHYLSLDLKRL